MGYTPVFDTVFRGTLCGRWPALPVWLSLLPLADWRGQIDMTPEAISAQTGWPLELLEQGIADLCAPDPRSRSKIDDGRRLVLIDPDRNWGWRVVNIQKYRHKASGADQVEDGRNAEKVRRYRERVRGQEHAATPADTTQHLETLTHTHTQTKTETKNQELERARGEFESAEMSEATRACILFREGGHNVANSGHPALIAALGSGITPEALRAVADEFPSKGLAYWCRAAVGRLNEAEARAREQAPRAAVPVRKSMTIEELEAVDRARGLLA